MFIETRSEWFAQLKHNLSTCAFPVRTCHGDFLEFLPEIEELANTHTVFLYVDPFKPGQVKFGDLGTVYRKLRQGQSVETLMNFMSTGFVRRAQSARERASVGGQLDTQHPDILACDEIAGGDYWQDAVCDSGMSHGNQIDSVASGYAKRLTEWFKYVLPYPIRENYGDEPPKYHLIFGSRHPDAIDLMNDAMVKARREFVGAFFVKDMLFANQPAEEVVVPGEIEELLLDTAKWLSRTTWRDLRIQAILAKPCMYTTSELNKGIKVAISSGKLGSKATGRTIENKADVWPLPI